MLCHIKLIIFSFLCQKRFMAAAFDDLSLIHDDNEICVPDRGQAMCDDNAGAVLHDELHGALDRLFGSGVYA